MLDDLRNTASNTPEPLPGPTPVRSTPQKDRGGLFLGMSAGQRFIIALLLFLMSCVMGAGCLVLTGKVYLPFF
jgi:hypothetical protein